jgi:2-succinyl-6-hydroxy-2,4-cyclohexadiene-1-carboxylate synthase
VALHAVAEGAGPRIVLVHGFTQTQACWGPVAADLARDHEVVRVDAPGHGGSGDVRADLREGAALLAEAGGPATYLGYSMGGRLLLHLALDRPDVVERLVVIGATAGIDDPAEREARRRADDALAGEVERDGVAAFVDRWLGQPLFAGLDESMQFRAERLTNTAAGLASSLRRAGTGTQTPLWDRLGAVEIPLLVVAGELDQKFTALGRRIVAAIGANAELAIVPAAGHTAHLEQPAAFLTLLRRWLAATGEPRP